MASPAATAPIRVLLAISHPRIRAALRSVLEGTGLIVVVAEVTSPLHLVPAAAAGRADLVVFDLRLAPPGVSPTLANLVSGLAGVPLVAVGLDSDPAFAREALRAGAAAHVLTDAPPERLLRAVRDALRR